MGSARQLRSVAASMLTAVQCAGGPASSRARSSWAAAASCSPLFVSARSCTLASMFAPARWQAQPTILSACAADTICGPGSSNKLGLAKAAALHSSPSGGNLQQQVLQTHSGWGWQPVPQTSSFRACMCTSTARGSTDSNASHSGDAAQNAQDEQQSATVGSQREQRGPMEPAAARAKARRIAPLVGVAAGLFGSLVGVGGGVLIVPAIVGACPGISQRLVSASSLVAVLATAAAATKTYSAASVVDLAAAAIIGAAAVCTAPLGAWLTTKLDAKALRRTLGWFLVSVAVLVPLKTVLLSQLSTGGAAAAAAASGSWDPAWAVPPAPKAAFLAASGALAGCATGLLGIGGGTVVTPLLAAAGGMPQAAVLGTALLAMLPPSAVALMQHARLGNVDWRLAAGLAAGAALGSWAGSSAAINTPPGMLEVVFSVGMLLLGAKTLRSGRRKR